MKELKFIIRLVDEETGEIYDRTDYDYSIERMQTHYKHTGLNVMSINQM